MKKFAFALLAAALAADSAQAGMAPLSSEFLKWREDQTKVRLAAETAATRNYGVRPSPLNLAHLAGNPARVAGNPAARVAADLPAKFDLREQGVVPAIRNQSSWGTCWAFATMAAVETNYLMQVLGKGADSAITSPISSIGSTAQDVDLSEMHLAWFSFMGPKMEQRFTNTAAKDIRNPTGSEVLNEGAFVAVPMAVFARGKGWGPVTEAEMPYIGATIKASEVAKELGIDGDEKRLEEAIANRTNSYCATNLGGKKPEDYKSVLRLKDASYAASTASLGKDENGNLEKLFKENRDAVKWLVMNRGALYVSFSAGGTPHNGAYYYTGTEDGHAVALIGWDDNYAVENFTADSKGNAVPSKPGAWLIRNSWGSDAEGHDGGYFWMSYEQEIGFGTAFSMAPADDLTTYTHSDLGWASDWGMGDKNTTLYGASVFKAGSNGGTLKEIGFYTTDNNATAELSVYVYDAKPTAANLTQGRTPALSVTAANVPYAGYHTIPVSDLAIKAGQYFSIVQKAVNPTYDYPLAVTAKINGWSDFAEMHDGEGYTSSNGTEWFDGVQATDSKGASQPITPCLYAFMDGTATGDEGEDTVNLTIDGVPVENLEDFSRDFNVDSDVNDALNANIPAGRKFTLTLAGTDGKPVAEGQRFTIYLMYTEDVLHWTGSSSASGSGSRMPSDATILPLYPAGYKPDLFLDYELDDDLNVDLPAYGPFEVTSESGGKVTLDLDSLTYADLGDVAKAGEKAKIPAGYHTMLYFSQVDGGACGYINELKVKASSGGGDSSGGCDAGLLGLGGLALAVAGLAARSCSRPATTSPASSTSSKR